MQRHKSKFAGKTRTVRTLGLSVFLHLVNLVQKETWMKQDSAALRQDVYNRVANLAVFISEILPFSRYFINYLA